jgi:hypothetical protein
VTRTPELADAVARAETAARAGRWPCASNEHLVVSLLADAQVASRLNLANVHAGDLRDEVDAEVRKLPPPIGAYVGGDFYVRTLEAQWPAGKRVSAAAVCGRLLRSPIPRALLVERGAVYGDLLYVLAHGLMPGDHRMASPYRDVLPDGEYRVILHGDDFTPVGFVVEILRDTFGIPAIDAAIHAATARAADRDPIATLPLAEALERITKATETARGYNCPLRLTVEPLDDDRPKLNLP